MSNSQEARFQSFRLQSVAPSLCRQPPTLPPSGLGLTFHTPLGIVRSTLARQPRRFELCLRALYKFS